MVYIDIYDNDIVRTWLALMTLLIAKRIIAYQIIRYQANKNK